MNQSLVKVEKFQSQDVNNVRGKIRLHFARRAVFKILESLTVGRLTIQDEFGVSNFGGSDSGLHAIVDVKNQSLYRQILTSGTVGAGESYMKGQWATPNLLKVIRVMVSNISVVQNMDNSRSWLSKCAGWALSFKSSNRKAQAKKNISAHYDLSNEFFKLMLDSNMMYSSAYFGDWNDDLESAAVGKLELVCKKIELKASDHLLEIGSGWGGMAIYAAKNYGCKVTTVTLSEEQYCYAEKWIAREGLKDKIELLLKDYRDLDGKYDKLVSIEMIEAVGYQFYEKYFKRCSSLLRPNGLMLIQAITIADQRYDQAKSTVDYIQKYIFPGGCLPSKAIIAHHVANSTDMQIINLHDLTAHYAKTLELWRERFLSQYENIVSLGFDSVFSKMWEFYLCYCEGGFLERVISTEQFLLAKPLARPSNSGYQI